MRPVEGLVYHAKSLNEKDIECRISKECQSVLTGLQQIHLQRGEEALAVGSEALALFSKVRSDQCDTQFAADMARMSTHRAIRDRPCQPLQVPPVGPSNRL